ncbi:hypothetical protein CJP74_00160 [Psittacicella melopsittaci]|uniref:DUF805 domain-containing protein n=1 Tax=Psittacicella melopsittaci TaxID=2028576 RepID=A0A3A1Y9Z5_9GAMM|nr:DUF805 domain-containing protein [Psittacicella melopsittaci]RIY34030.1 hypothetical protein CJP74_00160 [Psittacicella melopsittaci]
MSQTTQPTWQEIIAVNWRNPLNFYAYQKRRELNLYLLFYILVTLGVGITLGVLARLFPGFQQSCLVAFVFINVYLVIGVISALARRLRDAGQHPLWVLLFFIPAAHLLFVIACMCFPSKDQDNKYRTVPLFPQEQSR